MTMCSSAKSGGQFTSVTGTSAAGLPYLLRVVGRLGAPKVCVRGTDVAGTVEAVGQNVTRFQVGNEVRQRDGSFAEYASTPEDTLAPAGNLTFEQAAAIPTCRRRAPGASRRRHQGRPAGPARRGVGRRRAVRGPDRQIVRR